MTDSLADFQTFRRQEDPNQLSQLQLFERVTQLERQLQLVRQRQAILSRANDKLSRVIINNNQKHEQHHLAFTARIGQTHRPSQGHSGKSVIKTEIVKSNNSKILREGRQSIKHTRTLTEQNDENNFSIANNASSCILTRKEVKHKLNRQSRGVAL